jgi:hypothetical protein
VRCLAAWACGIALLLAACERTGSVPGPRLEARWTGTDSSHFSAEATAEWCVTLRVLTIEAMRTDTGVGLAIFPRDSVASGTFTIRRRMRSDTGAADSAARPAAEPSAALALRWFSKTVVRGFQGESGQVTLRRDGSGRLDGQFSAAAHSVFDEGRVSVTGSFSGLRVRPAPPGCGRRPRPRAPAGPKDSVGVD